MNKKLKILGLSNQDSGVYFYRVTQPLEHIGKQKLANVHHLPIYGQHNDHFTSHQYVEYFAKEAKWADVIVTTTPSDQEYLALILAMKERGKCKLVVDIDDDLLSAHTDPTSPAYQPFNDPSRRLTEYSQFAMKIADLLVVSTEYLKAKFSTINNNIVVIKNCIDTNFFKYINVPDKVTVGYAGSGSHQADWQMVEPILHKLKQKYNIKIKVLGPMQMNAAIDTQIKWTELMQYPEHLASLGFTIGIAPLKDSLMTRAKSNLRWLEYSAMGIPTVASDVVPFRGVKNILLATEPEDWERQLELLITDARFRTELGKNAYNEMRRNYDPNTWSRELYKHIERLFKG
jgi:glycosyltransferase involved in cell wall biosynthesis